MQQLWAWWWRTCDPISGSKIMYREDTACTSSVNRAIRISLLIRLVDKHLEENYSCVIHIFDLCQALGVSQRKLHQAIVLARGESPSAYLKRRRLMMSHQVLSNAGS